MNESLHWFGIGAQNAEMVSIRNVVTRKADSNRLINLQNILLILLFVVNYGVTLTSPTNTFLPLVNPTTTPLSVIAIILL